MEFTEIVVIKEAIRSMLRPIASLVLKCGMTWREFSDISKSAFVEKATTEFGIRGRPTNISRVSILTGISRKEVKRQRDLIGSDAQLQKSKTTDATRVLSGWYQDDDYLDKNSNPKLLQEFGPAPSFESLCAQYGGDIPETTMRKELLKASAIEQTSDGRLRALSRYFQPAFNDIEMLQMTLARIKDLVETVDNNVFPKEGGVTRFGGFADNDRIPLDVVPHFRAFLDERGQSFLEEIDDWLTEHAVASPSDSIECARIGVGMFAIDDRTKMEYSK